MNSFDEFSNNRLLVIDDNVDIHEDFRKILEIDGNVSELSSLSTELFGDEQDSQKSLPSFEIDTATQGQEGVKMVRAALQADRPYALAFVDMRMPPGWDGLSTIEWMWDIDPDLEIVICTAYMDYSWLEITEQLSSSVDRLLIIKKPFEIIEVRQLAFALTQRWSLRKQGQARQGQLELMVRRAQTERQESERKARAIINATTDAVLLLEEDGNILDINAVGADMLGGTPQSLAGINFCEVLPWASSICNQLKDTIQKGHPARFEYTHINSTFDCHVFPVRDAVDATWGAAFFFRDITEQQRDRQAMIQSSRMATVGLLAAGVAHEINNPLTYVMYNLEHLTKELEAFTEQRRQSGIPDSASSGWETDNESESSFKDNSLVRMDELILMAREALDGATRVRNIVKNLRSISHVDEGRLAPTKVNRSIEVAINMAFKEIKYRARLVKDLEPTPIIAANSGHLSQVFLNLLVNAAHAIPEGDVEHNEIRIRTWSEQEEVFVEVRDTGKGISPKHLERLFDPFFTTKDVGFGSGLGLSISHTLISSMGGRIEVESEPQKGSRFLVRLPVTYDAQEETTALSSAPPTDSAIDMSPPSSGRILIVDDEKCIGRVIRRLLSDHHEVNFLDSGHKARQVLAEDESYDLILCDMMMPEFSGMDLYDWLLKTNPDLVSRLVFMTGGAFTPKATEYLERVSNLHIEKPFDVANLKKLVNELIVSFRSKRSSISLDDGPV